MRRILSLLLLATFTLPAGAEVVKWTDAQGRVHYGDRPPADKSARATTIRGTVSVGDGMTGLPDAAKSSSSASDEFAKAVMAPRKGEVWIYTTPSCGYCRAAKEYMRLKGVAYLEKDISANAANKAEFRAMGGRGVPVTLSGSQRIVRLRPAHIYYSVEPVHSWCFSKGARDGDETRAGILARAR